MAWTVAAIALALAVVWRAWEAHRTGLDVYERARRADAELMWHRDQQARLRAEVDALRHDPAYVESLLRAVRHAEPGERIIAPPRPRTP